MITPPPLRASLITYAEIFRATMLRHYAADAVCFRRLMITRCHIRHIPYAVSAGSR